MRRRAQAPLATLRAVVAAMARDMGHSLALPFPKGGRTRMLPAHVDALPGGDEQGTFYALDLGGTNLRALAVELGAKKSEVADVRASEVAVPKEAYCGECAADLFGFIAQHFADFVAAEKQAGRAVGKCVGFTFSYPTEQTGVASGRLIEWTKGFTCKGVVGEDVVALLKVELEKRGLGALRVSALVNDTVGVLARTRYSSGSDKPAACGVILGTGTNACYVARTADITKESVPSRTGDMVINIEWGNFFDEVLPTLRADDWLDMDSTNFGEQRFEKMIGGMYLGELVQYILLEYAHTGIVFEGTATALRKAGAIPSKWAADMADDESLELNAAGSVLHALGMPTGGDMRERALARNAARGVIRRAGRLAAAGVTAVLQMAGGGRAAAVDGSVFEHNARFRTAMDEALVELLGAEAPECTLANDGSGIGAALLAAAADT